MEEQHINTSQTKELSLPLQMCKTTLIQHLEKLPTELIWKIMNYIEYVDVSFMTTCSPSLGLICNNPLLRKKIPVRLMMDDIENKSYMKKVRLWIYQNKNLRYTEVLDLSGSILNYGAILILFCRFNFVVNLNLGNCEGLNVSSLVHILRHCKNLKVLSLKQVTSINDKLFDNILKFCHNLESLNLMLDKYTF